MSESPATFPIVGVGASVGGMEAFGELLREVPAGTGLAFVFIQHPDSTHPGDLSATLARTTSFPVLEIQEGMRVEPEHVYVVPSHADVGIRKGTLALFPRSSGEGKPHRPIDFFFKGLAADLGNQGIRPSASCCRAPGQTGPRAFAPSRQRTASPSRRTRGPPRSAPCPRPPWRRAPSTFASLFPRSPARSCASAGKILRLALVEVRVRSRR